MSYHHIKKLFDEYLKKNHPEVDFYNKNDIENTMQMYGKHYKSVIPFRNLYFRKKIFETEKTQFLRRNPYIHNWKEEEAEKNEKNENKKGDGERRIYKCTLGNCNRQYTSAFGLKYHMKEGHSEKKLNVHKPFVCDVKNCGRKYKNNNGLKYHLKTFHNIK
ncbi:zinc finger C2H2 domain-containing protein [Vairimorpha necatrix]|uniref:Zinc finger C2H2 domain-containing protein n=1 Tax=Vairimorpha necatrix TaxID=6039 RepID=A0AAX4J906_9MICR